MQKFESKPLGPLTISSELGGKSVTSIGEDAFEDCDSLTKRDSRKSFAGP